MMHCNDFSVTYAVRPRVLVISDTLLYREGIARGLALDEKLLVAGVTTGREALAMMTEAAADAVLLDTAAPDALAVARMLKLTWPGVAVIGFGVGDDANSLACAEAGLVGFVGRDGTLAELATAVERALAGEVRCSPKLAALLCERVAALAGRMGDVPSGLTRRERQIADLVADGLSNKEIAIELRIGPATVKNHIHNILEKLHVPRRGAIGSRLRGVMA
jgi:two-component system, NarL family, nitrate/nitrite response regulator NarL